MKLTKKNSILIIICLGALLFYGYRPDIPGSIQMFLKNRFGIETKPFGRQLQLYQINNPTDCRIQHNLTRWFNWGCATFPNSKDFQKFYLAIKNLRKDESNVKNPELLLFFYNVENLEVDMLQSKYWKKSDPDGAYFIKIKDELKPSKISVNSLPALFIKFKEDSISEVAYEIKAANQSSERGTFSIYVGSPVSAIRNNSNLQMSATPSHFLFSEKKITYKTNPSIHLSTSPDSDVTITVTPNTVERYK